MTLTFSTMMALLFQIGSIILALSGLVAAVLAGITRDDAFEAADRQNKWIWVSMLALSALMVWLRFPFLSWIGLVIIGLYWFDVRPQIKDLLSGNGGWR
ncbi:putative secreted protein [Corynebacterium vitaeruminis DSM 20294]|uniref:Putative secreted protein n=2 Tax=Corynebacterium vitaeruminis TaxID=38305 RepID=W5XXI0_9CORY|nr:putative secreted protein [Corynebacterium vitaeruminis DSM 20294]